MSLRRTLGWWGAGKGVVIGRPEELGDHSSNRGERLWWCGHGGSHKKRTDSERGSKELGIEIWK